MNLWKSELKYMNIYQKLSCKWYTEAPYSYTWGDMGASDSRNAH